MAELEASRVLHLALQQIDGIIAGVSETNSECNYNPNVDRDLYLNRTQRKLMLLNELKSAIESDNSNLNNNNNYDYDDDDFANTLEDDTYSVVMKWLIKMAAETSQKLNTHDPEDVYEKVQFLEVERQNLMIQVNVLTEQIDSQSNKIMNLESTLSTIKSQLSVTDELFQEAVLSRSSIENTKFDLLSEVSKLRLELSNAEQSRVTAEERCRKIDNEMTLMRTSLLEKETEISSLKLTLAKMARSTGYMLNDHEMALIRGIKGDTLMRNRISSTDSTRVIDKPPLPSSPRPVTSAAFYPTNESIPLRRESSASVGYGSGRQSPSLMNKYGVNPVSSPVASPLVATRGRSASPMPRSTSAENVKPNVQPAKSSLTTPAYSTLPHFHGPNMLQQIQEQLKMHQMMGSFGDTMDGGNYPHSPTSPGMTQPSLDFRPIVTSSPYAVKSVSHSRSQSGVSFAPEEQNISLSNSARSSTSELTAKSSITLPPILAKSESKTKSGFKKIFGMIKRSGSSSQGFDSNFVRGGLRSTSGPRLGYSPSEKRNININLPFSRWDTNLVSEWFSVIGLGMYAADCKRWCRNGEHLMKASATEVEKELGIRNSLHRKKLRLAVSALSDGDNDPLTKAAGQLDYLWVARWCDDIGLPQYKDAFIDARIDGRVLHYLTIEDLFTLKITSQLHYASIRAGIEVLRSHKFDHQCLKRRAAPDETTITEWIPAEIALWTSHRVMEWLRTIDLSEYAPNLRGSGVHGGLIVHEVAFNADLFATLLSIPSGKTLLRRHITTHFKQLIGNDLCKSKRDYESQHNYMPMLPSAKIKAYRRGQFSLIKKRKCDVDFDDYVCPMPSIVSRASSRASSSTLKDSNSVSVKKLLDNKSEKITNV